MPLDGRLQQAGVGARTGRAHGFRSAWLPLLVLLACADSTVVPALGAAPRQSAPVTVTGVVRDTGNVPLADAEVRLVQDGRIAATATTDSGGGYVLSVSPAGAAALVVAKPGYGLGYVRHVIDATTPPGSRLNGLDVTVSAGALPAVPDGQPRVRVPGGSNGRVLTAGAVTDLSVQVADAGGTPMAGVTVLFITQAGGAGGTFAGSTEPDGSIVAVVADADGIATATYTAGGAVGSFIVDAVVPGSFAATSFAVSATAEGAIPAVTPETARGAAEAALQPTGLEGWSYRLFGPVLLQAGDTVAPATTASPTLPVSPVSVARPSWFFWSDDGPLFAFEHAVRYLLVDAQDPGRQQASAATWWPVIALAGTAQQVALLPPGSTNGAARRGAGAVMPPPAPDAGSSLHAEAVRYLGADAAQQPVPASQTGAIVIVGADEQQFQNDNEHYQSFAADGLKIPTENIFLPAGPAATKKDVANLIVQAKLKGIKRLYILITAHGHVEGFDVAPAGNSQTPDNVSWETFGQDLSVLAGTGTKVFIVMNACYAGNALGGLQGYGVNGYIATSADAQNPTLSFKVSGFAFGSPFVNTFITSFKDSQADPASDDAFSKTMDNLYDVLEQEGFLNFKELSTVGFGHPTEGPLRADAYPFPNLPDVTLVQGQGAQISIPRPPPDNRLPDFPTGAVPVVLTVANKQIADSAVQFGPTTYQASGNGNGSVYLTGDKPGTLAVIGLKPGVTEYMVEYRDGANYWKGKARITVTAPPGSPGSAPRPVAVLLVVSPIHALFVPIEFATHYSVKASSLTGDVVFFVWSLKPPANDMGCNHFDDGSGRVTAVWGPTAVWHHADISQKREDGCHHTTPEHDGVVTVRVSDQHGNAVTCHYLGTDTPPQGEDGLPCQ